MLQWMGGSRRKVTASRKSAQKRQKQYFEQRKRQQQQQTAGLESCSDVLNTCSRHQKNNRSLDILSLLNLSKVASEKKPSCSTEITKLENDGWTMKYHLVDGLPGIQTNEVTLADTAEIKEAGGDPSSCQVEAVYPNTVLSGASASCNNDLGGKGGQSDGWKTANEHHQSIFDLLGDDVPHGKSEGLHEAHVAFSIEGLGQMEMETPVHSPQQPGRIFPHGCPIQSKAARGPQSFKKQIKVLDEFQNKMDAVTQGICMPRFSSSFECSSLKESFGDEEIFYNSEDKNGNTWGAKSSFLDDGILDEMKFDLSSRNWPNPNDCFSADCLSFQNHELSDFAFGGVYPWNKRDSKKATDAVNILDLRATYSKHKISENDRDFINPDGMWHSTVGRDCDVRDVNNQPAWPCFISEDPRESMSLMSEESCSSSAVRGEAFKNPPSNSLAKQKMRQHGSDLMSGVSKIDVENICSKKPYHKKRDSTQQREIVKGPEKSRRISNLSHSKDALFNTTSWKEFGPDDGWLFEEAYNNVDINSDFSSLDQISTTKRWPSVCKLQTENLFAEYSIPELHANTKSSFGGSKYDISLECSSSGRFFPEQLAFDQSFSQVNSYEMPVTSNIVTGQRKPNVFPDCNTKCRPQYSFDTSGSEGDAEFPTLSVQESVSKNGEAESEILLTEAEKFELLQDTCARINGLSSENGNPVDVLDSKDNCSVCEEAKDKTSEAMESLIATCSVGDAEETSSNVKIPDKSEGNIDEKEYCNDAHDSPSCQNACGEIEHPGLKRKVDSKGQNNSVDSSYQVMMLESYVLQLLCVQKVLKEASPQDI